MAQLPSRPELSRVGRVLGRLVKTLYFSMGRVEIITVFILWLTDRQVFRTLLGGVPPKGGGVPPKSGGYGRDGYCRRWK